MCPSKAPPKTICILRLSALGDVSHVLPLLHQIQSNWPDCKITWVCGKFEYKILRLIDNVEFIVFDKTLGFKSYWQLWKLLKHRKFDALLHMQVAARANLASLCISAKRRIGWDKQRSRDLHHLFVSESVAESSMQHQVEGFMSFALPLGLIEKQKTELPVWNLPITESAKKFVAEHVDLTQPLLVISACSSHKQRNWTAQGYAAVADYAVEHYGFQVVLSGGPADIENQMADEIQNFMRHPALNLVGKDTLEQLLGLLNQADVVIAPDTGPTHLANAMGTPVIGLYGCTWSRRSGPYNSLKYCVDKFELAAQKFLNKEAENLKWGTRIEQPGVMELITDVEVCNQLDQLMKDLEQSA